jgi:SAM-dependent methyltransferase
MTGVTVLRNWNEIGQAISFLGKHNHRTHHNPIKSWDLRFIHETVNDLDRSQLVVDFGASVLGAVRLLYEMGFKRIRGYDLAFSKFDRLIQLRDWIELLAKRGLPASPPYRLYSKGLFDNGLRDNSVSAVICLSVIEHGIDQNRFFEEVSRLLKPGGRLFVSTDYWEPKISTEGQKMFGQAWTIFCKNEIQKMLSLAERHGLFVYPVAPQDFSCEDAVVHDLALSYTFIAIRFHKA